MNAKDFSALCVPASCTVAEALATLNQNGRGVLLVLHPDGRLRRTLTDGDLRRAALGHVAETTPLRGPRDVKAHAIIGNLKAK